VEGKKDRFGSWKEVIINNYGFRSIKGHSRTCIRSSQNLRGQDEGKVTTNHFWNKKIRNGVNCEKSSLSFRKGEKRKGAGWGGGEKEAG